MINADIQAQADDTSQKDRFSMSTNFGNLWFDGFTQYELDFLLDDQGETRIFGHSRLKFPINSYLSGGNLIFDYLGFRASFGFWGEYRSTRDEKMVDVDWLTSDLGDRIDVAFGTTTPFIDMYILEFDIRYNFQVKNFRLGPFFRYSRYHSEFSMYDLDQTWYYDLTNGRELDPPIDTFVDGRVLYYEQDLDLPIFGGDIGFTTDEELYYANLILGYSPLARVEDYDDHVIRQDSLEAWNSGTGGEILFLELGGSINVFETFWLNFNFHYNQYSIKAAGRQRTVDPHTQEVNIATGIPVEVRGVMRKVTTSISYLFNF